MGDYRQEGDPYGISAYTAQSAYDVSVKSSRNATEDVRGNTVFAARGVPTQEEADAIMRASREHR